MQISSKPGLATRAPTSCQYPVSDAQRSLSLYTKSNRPSTVSPASNASKDTASSVCNAARRAPRPSPAPAAARRTACNPQPLGPRRRSPEAPRHAPRSTARAPPRAPPPPAPPRAPRRQARGRARRSGCGGLWMAAQGAQEADAPSLLRPRKAERAGEGGEGDVIGYGCLQTSVCSLGAHVSVFPFAITAPAIAGADAEMGVDNLTAGGFFGWMGREQLGAAPLTPLEAGGTGVRFASSVSLFPCCPTQAAHHLRGYEKTPHSSAWPPR
jgi:hypothetical protein